MYLVITRAGDHETGSVYKFETLDGAELCPVVQYYDLIFSKPEHLSAFFKPEQLTEMFTRHSGGTYHGDRNGLAGATFSVLERVAVDPPKDAKAIVNIIAADRVAVGGFNRNNYKRTEGDEMAKAAKKATKGKSKPPTKRARFQPEMKISFLKDGEDKAYGNGNNPRREGSKRFKQFAKYKSGMTVADALKAGIDGGCLASDVKRKHIAIA